LLFLAANPIDHFSWFQKMGPLGHIPDYIVHVYFISILLIIFSYLAYRKLKNTSKNLYPEKKLTLTTLFELATEFILDLLRGSLGDKAPKYLPLVGSIFIFIFACNVIGLVPGFQPPTASLNTNFSIAITVFLFYNYMGFKENGFGYIKHFFGPVWWLAPLILVIELIGHFVRPLSLSLRLGGNMTGDHMVLGIFSDLIPLGVPIIFLGLGLFICFIQAFVFSLLSIIYIALATAHEH